MSDYTTEEWRPIPGWPKYDVSNLGRVRSWKRSARQPRIRKVMLNRYGYEVVGLSKDDRPHTHLVHRLVLLAFVGLPEHSKMVTRHLDGDKLNNRIDNLVYGTHSENNYDTVRCGNHRAAAKTHCKHGHEFTPENTYRAPSRPRGRACRTCRRLRDAQRPYSPRTKVAA